ncbi:hypothetical protein [Moraxella lacunata]
MEHVNDVIKLLMKGVFDGGRRGMPTLGKLGTGRECGHDYPCGVYAIVM